MSTYIAPFDLKPFQVDLIAQALSQPALNLGADCGTGKTIMAVVTACMRLDAGEIDHVLIECEKDKLDEWQDDLAAYTTRSVGVLKGGPEGRAKVIAKLPEFILGVYESFRTEIAEYKPVVERGRTRQKLVPGPLTSALIGKRVLLIWDEASAKMGANRNSGMYENHALLVRTLRKAADLYMLPTTATPVDRDPEGWFNLARLLDPEAAGTVESFESYHVDRNKEGKAVQFKCLVPEDCPPGVTSLVEKIGHLTVWKSKFEPDIAEHFPKIDPDSHYVSLGLDHQEFYEIIMEGRGEDPMWDKQMFTVARLIAGHPLSLVRSIEAAKAEKRDLPQVAQMIVREVGEAGLAALGAAKLDKLVQVLREDVAGSQAVIFTFYGKAILPLIQDRLVAEGFEVVVNHGDLSVPQKRKARHAFRDGCQILLSSDAGCRGINLPAAQWVINYELPLTHSKWWQRINRANRLDSTHPVTYVRDLVAKNTVEEGIVSLGLKRHAWSDALTDDNEDGSNYLSAEIRKELMKISRARAA